MPSSTGMGEKIGMMLEHHGVRQKEKSPDWRNSNTIMWQKCPQCKMNQEVHVGKEQACVNPSCSFRFD